MHFTLSRQTVSRLLCLLPPLLPTQSSVSYSKRRDLESDGVSMRLRRAAPLWMLPSSLEVHAYRHFDHFLVFVTCIGFFCVRGPCWERLEFARTPAQSGGSKMHHRNALSMNTGRSKKTCVEIQTVDYLIPQSDVDSISICVVFFLTYIERYRVDCNV